MPRPLMPSVSLLLDVGGLAGLRVHQACRELGLSCLEAPAPEIPAETLVARARAAGCRLVHPGEVTAERQLALARACRSQGLGFVGPSPALIEAMCDPQAIRQLMREAGLPLVDPGEVDAAGQRVTIPVLADGRGRVCFLPPRHVLRPGVAEAPVPWLTAEQRAYLGQLAVQGVTSLTLTGFVTLHFRVADNRVGLLGMTPGLSGSEALEEALCGLDPVIEQLRLAMGERLRDRQDALTPRGHALLWRLQGGARAAFSGGPGLRFDRAGEAGEGRLLAWGRRPEEAWRRARRGLEELLGERTAAGLLGPGPVP